jgi:hypothetical protein
MNQQVEASFSNWPYLQTRLLYSPRAKAATAPKRRVTVERRLVIEDDLE